jgi:hypothetical protein
MVIGDRSEASGLRGTDRAPNSPRASRLLLHVTLDIERTVMATNDSPSTTAGSSFLDYYEGLLPRLRSLYSAALDRSIGINVSKRQRVSIDKPRLNPILSAHGTKNRIRGACVGRGENPPTSSQAESLD